VKKGDRFEDLVLCAILRSDFRARANSASGEAGPHGRNDRRGTAG
jgi:hypothetical protein